MDLTEAIVPFLCWRLAIVGYFSTPFWILHLVVGRDDELACHGEGVGWKYLIVWALFK
jgi:hypothetical protein